MHSVPPSLNTHKDDAPLSIRERGGVFGKFHLLTIVFQLIRGRLTLEMLIFQSPHQNVELAGPQDFLHLGWRK